MKDTLVLIIKGFIIGVANIIPGVSGGTLAITLGIYEELIGAISHFFKDFKKNLQFVIPIGIGAVLSILLLSKVISYSLNHFPFSTTLFFIGLILGGIPLLYKKVKDDKKTMSDGLIFFLTFLVVIVFAFLKSGGSNVSLSNLGVFDYLLLFFIGMITSSTMVIPGISGSFVLMLLGFYQPIIDTISRLTKFQNVSSNLLILIPFGIGVVVGIILIAKLIEFLLSKFEKKTYYGILGFVLASILTIVKPLVGVQLDVFQVLFGILLFLVGTVVAYRLGDE